MVRLQFSLSTPPTGNTRLHSWSMNHPGNRWKSSVGNQVPNICIFREERKLKEGEKRKREEKTGDFMPVLGQVDHLCFKKWTASKLIWNAGKWITFTQNTCCSYVNTVCYSCQEVPLRVNPSKKREPDGGKGNLCQQGKCWTLKVFNVIIILPYLKYFGVILQAIPFFQKTCASISH